MTDERTEHGRIAEWLDAWRTGELSAERAERVEAHLEACPDCRAALADLEAFSSVVEAGYRDAEAARPEPDWGARRAAIVERTSGRRRDRAPWIIRWAPQVAIVLVAVVAIGVLVEQGVRDPVDAERVLRAPDRETAPVPAAPGAADEEIAEPAIEESRGESGEAGEAAPADDAARPDATPPRDADANVSVEPQAEDRAPPADAAARVEPEAGRAAAMGKAAPDAGARFRSRARSALEARDSAAAADALEFWSDSVEPARMPLGRRDSLEALADSLAVFLAARP